MTDIVWPPTLRQSHVAWRPISNSERSTPGPSGAFQSSSKPGDRLGCVVTVENASAAELRRLRTLLHYMRGTARGIYLPDLTQGSRVGAWVGGELLTNPSFEGTTGWTADSKYSLTAVDNVLRSTVVAGNGGAAGYPAYQTATYTQFAPHVTRILARLGRGTFSSLQALVDNAAGTALSSSLGYAVTARAAQNASQSAGIYDGSTSGLIAGDYFETHFASTSRCLLTDSGGNLLTRSSELDHADWSKVQLTASANAAASIDGTSTAEKLVPSSSNTLHYASQTKTVPTAADDFMICGYFAAGGYNFVRLYMAEASGSTAVYQSFNLNTGAVGVTSATGANWSNARAFIVNMGGGWYFCCLIARKTNAATSLEAIALVQNADNASAFIGDTTSGAFASHLTLFQSSNPMRPVTATSAAVAASTHARGASAIYVKGGPASMAAAMRVGEAFEIDRQIKFVTSPLYLDAAGRGYLQFEPTLARAVSNNTPVILHQPLCKMRMVSDNDYAVRAGLTADFEFAFEQDNNA